MSKETFNAQTETRETQIRVALVCIQSLSTYKKVQYKHARVSKSCPALVVLSVKQKASLYYSSCHSPPASHPVSRVTYVQKCRLMRFNALYD